MKNIILLFLIFITSGVIYSQNINGRFSSSIYAFENYDSLESSTQNIRGYQLLNLNVNYDKISLKTYLNFESNFSNKLDDDPRLRFYNLFLEGRNLFDIVSFKLGRQPIFAGVGSGLFDGLSLDMKYSNYKLTLFGGGNVPAYQKLELAEEIDKDYLLGGKISSRFMDMLSLDLSYVKKNFKPREYNALRLDEDLNPLDVIVRNKSAVYEYASAKLGFDYKDRVSTTLRYDYDVQFEKTSRIEFNNRTEVVKNLGVNLYYNYREPRINYNSIFSVFNYGSNQEIELGADYMIFHGITVLGKFAYVDYDQENSKRFSLGVNTNYGSVNFRKSLGFSGELMTASVYTAHSFLDGFLTPNLGFAYTEYKLPEEDENNDLLSLLVGLNVRPINTLSFDVQGQYMNNRIYKNDFRFFLKLNYWFNTNLNLL